MTHTATYSPINTSDTSSAAPLRAVLFDLSGTLIDESYISHGVVQVATDLDTRWGIDPGITLGTFMPTFRAISSECADQPFYMMRDMLYAVLDRLIVSCGHHASRGDLVLLEHAFWMASIPAATPAQGAIEILGMLADAGTHTGIVSYADIPVFDALLEQTGLAGLTEVELCSEMARSCKPHPAIFRQALAALKVEPVDALFVGDSVDCDVVGANRVGMGTALLTARKHALGGPSSDNPDTHPDHHIDCLLDIVDLAIHNRPTNRCA